ncbi:MAG: serine hydrolase domain-containing protein [Bacteroidales bacterium]
MAKRGSVASHLQALIERGKTPGLQYLATDADGTLFEWAGGFADVARGDAMTSSHTLMAYSMSKTLTAAAVLQLVEEGSIDLEAPVVRYLDCAPYRGRITVRQLLAHTSGAPNPIPLRWVHPASEHATFDENIALASVLRRHGRLAFAPGTRYRYSNIGYWLLGAIVERVTRQRFAERVQATVLDAIGARHCELGYSIADPSHHAAGYLAKYSLMNLVKGLLIDRGLVGGYERRWLGIRPHFVNGAAFGGLVGSARGFGRFLQDQLAPRSHLFEANGRALFYEEQRLADARPVAMTLGWHIGSSLAGRFFFKEGGGGGFHCLMRLYPDEGFGTVLMANTTSLRVHRILDDVDGRIRGLQP